MPEINHKTTSQPQQPQSQQTLASATLAGVSPVQPQPSPQGQTQTQSQPQPNPVPTAAEEAALKQVVSGLAGTGTITFTEDELEAKIKQVLAKGRAEAVAAAKPKEPNWATMSEQDAYRNDVYIPTIDHEVPDYMNMELRDPEYMVVWASRDQRRIGQLKAEGYELLKKEDVHPRFNLPLLFDSEGMYTYIDVVAMKVHKRILMGKRKKILQVSLNQLSNRNRPPRMKMAGTFDQVAPINPSAGEFYEAVI